MAQQNQIPVAEGDKIEIDDEDDVYTVTWVGISIKAQPASGERSLSDTVKFGKDEFTAALESGRVTILSDDEPTTAAARELRELADVEHLVDRLEGRNGGLRSSKPQTDEDDGLTQCVWRYARMASGADTSMPVTANWWLQDYLDENGIDASVSGITDDAGTEIVGLIFDLADAVLGELGLATGQGAQRWKGVAF